MGAAAPIIGAATAVASTVSGISSQQRQRQAQQSALDSQARATAQNAELRLLELESQKLYREQQLQLNNNARQQQYAITDAQMQMEEKALSIAEQEARLNQQLNNKIIQTETGIARSQNETQLFSQLAGNQLNYNVNQANADTQYNIGTQRNQLDTLSAGFRNVTDYGNAMVQMNAQEIGLQERLNSELQNISIQYKQANAEEKQRLRQQATNLVMMAGGGGISDSQRASLVGYDNNQATQRMIDMALSTGKTRDMLLRSTNFNRGMLDQQRLRANQGFQFQGQNITAQSNLQQFALDSQRKISRYQNEMGTALNNLTAEQQAAIARIGIDTGELLQLNLNDLTTQQELAQIGLDKQALETLKLAQKNTRFIQEEQDKLNMQFQNLGAAGDAAAFGIQSQAQLEQMSAQSRANVPGSGVISGLSNLAQTGINLYSQLNKPQPYQPQPKAINAGAGASTGATAMGAGMGANTPLLSSNYFPGTTGVISGAFMDGYPRQFVSDPLKTYDPNSVPSYNPQY